MNKIKTKIIACFLASLLIVPLVVGCACGKRTALATPDGAYVEKNKLYWQEVENAIGYKVRVEPTVGASMTVDAYEEELSLTTFEDGDYTFYIQAVAGNSEKYKDSEWRKTPKYTLVVNKILVLGSDADTENIKQLINEDLGYRAEVVAPQNAPTTVEELNVYAEVILMDVGSNLSGSFNAAIAEYANLGGGVLNVGGENSFVPSEYNGTAFQSVMPVEAITYRPPSAAYMLLDNSDVLDTPLNIPGAEQFLGDTTTFGILTNTMVWFALYLIATNQLDLITAIYPEAADYIGFLDEMNLPQYFREEDKMGLIAIGDGSDEIFGLTPMTGNNLNSSAPIGEGFTNLNKVSGTPDYARAINTASASLKLEKNLGLKHILIISDGNGGIDVDDQDLNDALESCVEWNIQVSTIAVTHEGEINETLLTHIAETTGGLSTTSEDAGGLPGVGGGGGFDLGSIFGILGGEGVPYNIPEFSPKINTANSLVTGGVTLNSLVFTGYNPVDPRDKSSVVLDGVFGKPLFVYWENDQGAKLGCFMSDLKGTSDSWSDGLYADVSGKRLVTNLINFHLSAN